MPTLASFGKPLIFLTSMSKENNIKDITNKLIDKYKETSWSVFLSEMFNSFYFQIILNRLVSDAAAKIKFAPSLKMLFRPFETCSMNNLKIVIINIVANENSDGLALSGKNKESKYFTDAIIKDNPFGGADTENFDKEYLAKQGVLLINKTMTCEIGDPSSHVDMWSMFAKELLTFLQTKENIVYVFIGEPDLELSGLVKDHSYKFFLPEVTEDWNYGNVFVNVNKLLTRLKREKIEW